MERKKRLYFTIRIGPELKKILDEQVERILDVTHGVANRSYWEAGEIVAKKVKDDI